MIVLEAERKRIETRSHTVNKSLPRFDAIFSVQSPKMVSFIRMIDILGLLIVSTLLFDHSFANQEFRGISTSFRYPRDLEAAASEHGSKTQYGLFSQIKYSKNIRIYILFDIVKVFFLSMNQCFIMKYYFLLDSTFYEFSQESIQTGEGKHQEKGGGTEYEEDHHAVDGEKGDKGYKVFHEFDKGEKGHHDKEGHKQRYDEKKGEEQQKHEEAKHYDESHRGEEGEKAAKFDEEGKHQKGYSTKGEHSVFKKDEYEKKHDFYDEYHEDGDHEKHGGYHHEHEGKKGGHEKIGHLDSARREHHHGKKKKHEEGHHNRMQKGRKLDEGHDNHHRYQKKYGKKGGHDSGKKWHASKGHYYLGMNIFQFAKDN
ncbi:uncharacterized protein LOC143177298 [Calliopsis andreniformis]|uniref:uncharacterized protein LOC143177298 n=1 Tax=Calliopsis andreniformis TaxID=337506 RepID=UPI003FCC79E2